MNALFRLLALFRNIPRSVRSQIAWGYCFLLIYLLITPSPLSPLGGWGLDTEEAIDRTLSGYVQHALAYTILVWVFWWNLSPLTPKASWKLAGALSLHGSVFEGLQYFIPSRESDWKDLLCNLSGIAVGWSMMQFLSYWGRPAGPDLPDLEKPKLLPHSIPLERGS